jgi:hypothetical protein
MLPESERLSQGDSGSGFATLNVSQSLVSTEGTPVVRKSPRISINKLAEYMVAGPGRRRTIIKNQKSPKDFMVAYYSQVSDVIAEYFEKEYDAQFLEKRISAFEQKPVSSDWDETRKGVSIEALQAFADILSDLEFPQYKKVAAPRNQDKIQISGVSLSVRPEVLLKQDGKVVGAIKLAIIKGERIDDKQMDYIGTGLLVYMRELYGESIKANDCYTIDVFGHRLCAAPSSIKRRSDDLRAACEEIFDTWQRV